MKKYGLLFIVATMAAAIMALPDVTGNMANTTHAQASLPSNISAVNGSTPGEVVVSWDPVAGASSYRVG
jgi:hypothetical protein